MISSRLTKKNLRSKKQALSVVIHTKNEEKMIVDCIKSVKKIADEIIVADMNSSDKTIELARNLGARIVSVPVYDFVEPARNFAISKAKNDWILVLDADERIGLKLGKTIKKIVEKNTYDVVSFPRKNIILNKWMKHGLRWPDYQNRLFRKGFVQWSDAIHEKDTHKGRFYKIEPIESNALIHYNYSSVDQLMEKTIRYASNERYYDNKKDLTTDDIHKRMEGEFSWRFYEHNGYRDGTHGLIVSKFMQVYRFLELAMFWEREGMPELATSEELRDLWSNERENHLLTEELNQIKDSRFYMFWKIYTRVRNFIKKIF